MTPIARIHRLAAKCRIVSPERCPGRPTMIVGAEENWNGEDAWRCPHCRQAHVLVIEEIIVESSEAT